MTSYAPMELDHDAGAAHQPPRDETDLPGVAPLQQSAEAAEHARAAAAAAELEAAWAPWVVPDETVASLMSRAHVPPLVLRLPLADRHVALRPGAVVEIAGGCGSGCTGVLLHAAATALLPRPYGGAEAGVILLDCDGRFDLPRLWCALRARIAGSRGGDTHGSHGPPRMGVPWVGTTPVLSPPPPPPPPLGPSDDELADACLAQLSVIRCPSSHHYLLALRSLVMAPPPGARLLLIDSLGAHHARDKAAGSGGGGGITARPGVLTLSCVHDCAAVLVTRISRRHRLIVLATKRAVGAPMDAGAWGNNTAVGSQATTGAPAGGVLPAPHEYLSVTWQRVVTHRLVTAGPYEGSMGGPRPLAPPARLGATGEAMTVTRPREPSFFAGRWFAARWEAAGDGPAPACAAEYFAFDETGIVDLSGY